MRGNRYEACHKRMMLKFNRLRKFRRIWQTCRVTKWHPYPWTGEEIAWSVVTFLAKNAGKRWNQRQIVCPAVITYDEQQKNPTPAYQSALRSCKIERALVGLSEGLRLALASGKLRYPNGKVERIKYVRVLRSGIIEPIRPP